MVSFECHVGIRYIVDDLEASFGTTIHTPYELCTTVGIQVIDSSVLTKLDQIREFSRYFCKFSPFLAFLPFDIGSNKGIFQYLEYPLYIKNH